MALGCASGARPPGITTRGMPRDVERGSPDRPRSPMGMAMLRQPTILVVDDEPDDRVLMGAELYSYGCNVLYASNGERACEVARAESPDAVIVDLFLGNVLGLDLIGRLRSLSTTRDAKIFLLTACDPTGIESEAIRRGATAVMVKSYDCAQLRPIVDALLVA